MKETRTPTSSATGMCGASCWDRRGRGVRRPPPDVPSPATPFWTAPATSVLEVRLPAALFREREFVVEGQLATGSPDCVVQFQGSPTPPRLPLPIDAKSPLVASAKSAALPKLMDGFDEFRRLFPQ